MSSTPTTRYNALSRRGAFPSWRSVPIRSLEHMTWSSHVSIGDVSDIVSIASTPNASARTEALVDKVLACIIKGYYVLDARYDAQGNIWHP